MLPIINILVGQQPMEGMHHYVCITTIDSNIIQVRVRFFINLELDYCIQSFGNGWRKNPVFTFSIATSYRVSENS